MEIIESRAVHPFTVDDDGDPLLAVELARAAVVDPVPLPAVDGSLRAEMRRLAAADDAVEIRPVRPVRPGRPGWPGGEPPGSTEHPICLFFPWICRPPTEPDADADG